jgi:hypothetical protein
MEEKRCIQYFVGEKPGGKEGLEDLGVAGV